MITRRNRLQKRPQPLQFKGCGCPTCDATGAALHSVGYGAGLNGFFDDVGKGVSNLAAPIEKKLQRLEFALTAILVLSAIAASTGVFNSVRRR